MNYGGDKDTEDPENMPREACTGAICPNLMVVDGFGGRTELLEMSYGGWTSAISANSREEMDLKLAVIGLKTDWDGYDWNNLGWSRYQHRIWRIQ